MKNKTLLILAAGMGSRYGGLKQTEKFGPNGEFIIDYSIYDAIKNGFNKVVFVIKEENFDLFKETIGNRIESHVNVEYVFQKNDYVPSDIIIPESRVKPLGTAHAILCAKNCIHEPFIMINADDYYGYNAYNEASEILDTIGPNDIGIIGYNVLNTMTENGSVKRGVIREENGELIELVESSIISSNGQIEATALSNGVKSIIDSNTMVSMNLIGFNPSIFDYIESNFIEFLNNSDLEKDEYLIPDVITKYKNEKRGKVSIYRTSAKWVGVTYKEDKESVQNYINSLIEKGIYKENLWS